MNVGVSGAILASFISLTIAIAIWLRRPRRWVYTLFSLFSLSLFLFHATSVATSLGTLLGARLQIAAALLIPPLAILFFRDWLHDRSRMSRRLARIMALASIAFLCVDLLPWGAVPFVRVIAASYVLTALALVLQTVARSRRFARSESDRKRLRYPLYGGIVALLLATGALIPHTELPAAIGHVTVAIYLYFLYQSVLARRLVDFVELLGKAAVLAILTVMLTIVYALLVLWVGSGQPGLWFFNTLVASFVILVVYDPLRPFVEEATAKLIFSERFEVRRLCRALVRSLRTVIGLSEMRDRVVEALSEMSRINHVAIYFADDEETGYTLLGFRGVRPPDRLSLAHHSALVQEIRRQRRPILIEHLLHREQEIPAHLRDADATLQREIERTAEAMTTMRSMGASALIPMLAEEHVLGLLTVGTAHIGESFSADELASLMSVAEACAVVIENSQQYEARRERDRLAALGEMAAGIAHEIRNPLGAIKGAAQCLDPGVLPEHAKEFIEVIIEETDRLNRVLAQFLEYARPLRGKPEPTDVNRVVVSTLKLLTGESVPANVTIVSTLAEQLPSVSVDPEHFKQVLLNLVFNSIHAMPNGGQIVISTSVGRETGLSNLRSSARAPVLVRVEDNGTGIAPENLSRIFVPFFTTKPHGTGLGLAISQRLIQSAGGSIEVASYPGQGTTFTMRLPTVAPGPSAASRVSAAS
jgi:two-component system sensor histidine kinase HydH